MKASPLRSGDPESVGSYRLIGRLGEGGQGVVFLGQGPSGEHVAVKVLKTTDPVARARFTREMQAVRQVAAFCTASVLDSSTEGARPYVVSEYIDGPSLQEQVGEEGPLHHGELTRLAVNTATALVAIHAAGIVHRDLKPANVLLGPDGPRVVDFGIARAMDAETHTQPVGTPSYFAPEWMRGHPPSDKSDVFAWAGTIVYAATGQPPFGTAPTVAAIMYRIANDEPDLSQVPLALRPLLYRCLSKDPAQRPSARELRDELVGVRAPGTASGSPIRSATSQPTSPGASLRWGFGSAVRRNRRLQLLASLAASLLAAALALIWLWPTSPNGGGKSPQGEISSTAEPIPLVESEFTVGSRLQDDTWAENKYSDYVEDGYRIASGSGSNITAMPYESSVAQVMITARVKLLTATKSGRAGITCRNASDAENKAAPAYAFVLGSGGEAMLEKRQQDSKLNLGTVSTKAAGKQFHELKARCTPEGQGLRLVFWVDGTKVIDVVDRVAPLPPGTAGLVVDSGGGPPATALCTYFLASEV